MADDETGRVDRDRVIGEPEAPLPEPWFIRDLKMRNASRSTVAEAPPPVAPREWREPEAAAWSADSTPIDERRAKPWYLSPFFLGGLAVTVVMLVLLFSGSRVDGPTGGAIVPPSDAARVEPRIAEAVPEPSPAPAEIADAVQLPPEPETQFEPIAPPVAQPRIAVARQRDEVLPEQPEPVAVPRDFSPSFDCDRVTSRVNQMICASPDLAALDRRMSRRFDRVASRLDPDARDELEDSRVRFLQRKQSCGDEACIERVYVDRIEEIASYDDLGGGR